MKPVKSTRTRAALALLAAAVGVAVAFAEQSARDADAADAARKSLGIVSTDRDGFRYEFHAPSGSERLFDLRRDPGCLVDVSRSHPELVRACREELLESLGAKSLEELRAPYAETIRRLEAMGYF